MFALVKAFTGFQFEIYVKKTVQLPKILQEIRRPSTGGRGAGMPALELTLAVEPVYFLSYNLADICRVYARIKFMSIGLLAEAASIARCDSVRCPGLAAV